MNRDEIYVPKEDLAKLCALDLGESTYLRSYSFPHKEQVSALGLTKVTIESDYQLVLAELPVPPKVETLAVELPPVPDEREVYNQTMAYKAKSEDLQKMIGNLQNEVIDLQTGMDFLHTRLNTAIVERDAEKDAKNTLKFKIELVKTALQFGSAQ